MTDEDERVVPPARGRCGRCGLGADDLWTCMVDDRIALLCPACVADRRAQGRDVRVMEERP